MCKLIKVGAHNASYSVLWVLHFKTGDLVQGRLFLLFSHPSSIIMQMILVSITFFGCIVVGVVFIVGFAMEKQEGMIQKEMILFKFSINDEQAKWFNILPLLYRLTNEQRAAVADYFRVYKVLIFSSQL